jgi:TP901 family phage tail tape measure protein
MASLGNISATFTAQVDGFISGVKKMAGSIDSITKKMNNLKTTSFKSMVPDKQVASDFGNFMNLVESGMSNVAKSTKVPTTMIRTNLETIGGVTGDVTTSYKLMGDKWVEVNKRMVQSSDQSFGSMMKSMINLKSFVAKIVHYITFSIGVQLVMAVRTGIQTLIKTTIDYQREITNAITVSGYLGAAFDNIAENASKLATELSGKTTYAAMDVAKSLYTIASAGVDVAKVTEKELLPILNYAEATQTDLDKATQSVIETLNQFQIAATDSSKVVDIFTYTITKSFATSEKLAASLKYAGAIFGETGQELKTLNAMLAVLYNRGIEGGQAGQRLNMMMTKLLEPTEEGTKRIEELGLNLRDLDPYTNNAVDILEKFKAANMRAGDAVKIFGTRTAAAVIMLVSQSSEVRRYNDLMALSEGVTERLANKQRDTLYGSLKLVDNELKNIYISFTGVVETLVNFGVTLKTYVGPPMIALLHSLTILGPLIGGTTLAVLLLKGHLASATLSTIAATTGFSTLGMAVKSLTTSILPMLLIFNGISMAVPSLKKHMMLLSVAFTAAIVVVKLFGKAKLADIVSMKAWIVSVIAGKINLAKFVTMVKSSIASLTLFKVALAAATVGISLVIGAFFMFQEQIKRSLNLLKQSTEVYADQIRSLRDFKDGLVSISSLQRERLRLQNEINIATKNNNTATDTHIKNLKRLEEIETEINNVRNDALAASEDYVRSISDFSTELDTAIKYHTDYVDLGIKESSLINRKNQLIEEETALELDYSQAIKKSHGESEESRDITQTLNIVRGELISVTNNLELTQADLLTTHINLINSTDKLNSKEKLFYGIASRIVDVQRKLIDNNSLLSDLEKDRDRILEATNDVYGALEIATRDFWEKQLKLFTSTEKLYKLEKSRPGILEEIFSSLADQGMITSEIIDLYKDLVFSQADLSNATRDYFKMFYNLSPDQQKELSKSLDYFTEMIAAGVEFDKAWKIAFKGFDPESLMVDLGKYDIEPPTIDWTILETIDMTDEIYEYAGAFSTLRDSMTNMGSDLEPFLNMLMESGVLTEEQVNAFMKWLKLPSEIANETNILSESIHDLNFEFGKTLRLLSDVWSGSEKFEIDIDTGEFKLSDEGEKILDLEETFRNFASSLPAVSRLIDSNNDGYLQQIEILDFLSTATGRQINKVSELSDAELITIASTYEFASATGQLTKPLSTVKKQLSFMGSLVPFEGWAGQASLMINPLSTIVTKIGEMTTIMSEFTDELRIMIKMMGHMQNEPEAPHFLENLIPVWGAIRNIFHGIEMQKWADSFNTAKGGIFNSKSIPKLAKGIKSTRGPMSAIIGEDGAEAVIPLEGSNKKYGESILSHILPKYFSDMNYLERGSVPHLGTNNLTSDTNEYNFYGDFNISGIENGQQLVEEFMDELKRRRRMSV